MNIENKTVLITGANRGIGRALVDEALIRGAKRVYAGTRGGALQATDSRVTPVTLDVTNASQIQKAAEEVETLDVLINNAGVAIYDDLSNADAIEQHLAVNFLGMFKVTRAFLPLLRQSKGAIVNNLSLVALAPLPVIPGYSISKAAASNIRLPGLKSSEEQNMWPACITSTTMMVAGVGSTGGILAVCIGKFRKFFRASGLILFEKTFQKK